MRRLLDYWPVTLVVVCGVLSVSAIITGGLMEARAQALPPPTTTPWFTANIGPTTCRVSKVSQTPIRVSWVCTNLYGATSGSYTADPTNGLNGGNYFDIGLNTVPVPGVPNPVYSNARCNIQMNGSPNPLAMVDGVTVPGNGASYSCSGYQTNGAGVVTWP